MDTGVGLGSEAPSRRGRTRLWPVLPLAAFAWWVVGALPWLLAGLGTGSLKELSAHLLDGGAADGYVTLLPFHPALLPQLLVVTLCGGAAAGLATTWLRDRRDRRLASTAAAVAGSFVATAYAVAQSAGATRQLGGDFNGSDRVLAGVVAVAVVGSVAGTALGLLVALGGPVGRSLAAAPLAVAAGGWAGAVLIAVLGVGGATPFLPWALYVSGALVGLALAALGLHPARRLAAWPAVLLVVALCTAAMTAFAHVAGLLRPGPGLPTSLADLRGTGLDAFLLALRPEHQPWALQVVALAGGLAGALVLWRRPEATDAPETSLVDDARDAHDRTAHGGDAYEPDAYDERAAYRDRDAYDDSDPYGVPSPGAADTQEVPQGARGTAVPSGTGTAAYVAGGYRAVASRSGTHRRRTSRTAHGEATHGEAAHGQGARGEAAPGSSGSGAGLVGADQWPG